MSIKEGIQRVASEYLTAKTQPLRDHPLAGFIRDTFPADVAQVINTPDSHQKFVVQGTKLPGNWAAVPWIGIMDPRLTDGIQRGIYVVLAFAADMQTVYLNLVMGVQGTPRKTRVSWLQQLQHNFPAPSGFVAGPLPPGSLAAQGIGTRYEQAVVYFKKYEISTLPEESVLEDDFRAICDLLGRVGDSGQYRVTDIAEEDEKISFTIQGREFRFSVKDVEDAFSKTTEQQWKNQPGVEAYRHVIVDEQSKPIKAVFRNLVGVPESFTFTTDGAARVFERLGFEVIDTRTVSHVSDLCLLGTWGGGITSDDAARVQAVVASKGGWASWWSFPIRDEFHEALRLPFYFYVNAGGGRFPYRMKVERFLTSHGNDGIESPWPEITDAEAVGKTRIGPKNSEVFKTWLYVTEFEQLQSPLSLDDFDPAPGVKRSALLNQSSFGYARLVGTTQRTGTHIPMQLSDFQAPKNLILYGPPGTGKTYWLREQCAKYTDKPSEVDYDTWLQELLTNYGWRPVIAAALADLDRAARVPDIRDHPLVQAKTKQRGRTSASVHATLWGYLQEHTPETVETVKISIRRPPYIFSKRESSEWELLSDWQEQDEESVELVRLLQAGPGGAKVPIRRYRVVTFHPSFSYEDFIRGIRPVTTAEDGTTQFRVVDGIFKQICDEARANPSKRYALFIDEINRANIAKVFGELIALIEPDKRVVFDEEGRVTQGMVVQLPGGDVADVAEPPFGVPANLDIYGTMNTADRSIALLDVALRRRFEFQEMEPNYAVINRNIGAVHLGSLLKRINDRLEYLLDRDHRIGHAYLIAATTLADLRRVFRVQIIPLLQEYFFDDLSRVAMVLAAGQSAPPLIGRELLRYSNLFSGEPTQGTLVERTKYVVTPDESWTEGSFSGTYSSAAVGAEIDEVV
jgi:5-methylcytosine-specific restriction protein B